MRGRRRRGRADPGRVPRLAVLRPTGACRSPSAPRSGIATYPEDGRSATDLLAVADRGLYDAKAAGGNRVGPDPEAVAEVDADADVEAPIELGAHRRRIGEPLARPTPVGEPLEAPVQSSGA